MRSCVASRGIYGMSICLTFSLHITNLLKYWWQNFIFARKMWSLWQDWYFITFVTNGIIPWPDLYLGSESKICCNINISQFFWGTDEWVEMSDLCSPFDILFRWYNVMPLTSELIQGHNMAINPVIMYIFGLTKTFGSSLRCLFFQDNEMKQNIIYCHLF